MLQDDLTRYDSLSTEQKTEVLRAAVGQLPDKQKKDIAQQYLPQADKNVWYLVISGLLVVALASLGAAVFLGMNGKTDSTAWAIVTTSVGALVGLFAPSPVGTKKS